MGFFFFQAEDGIRDAQESRGLGDVYKRQVDELSKSVKILSPEDKLKYPSSGGGYIGLSTSPDKSYAQQYSRQIAGRDDVAELFIQPNAKIKNIKGAIDDMSADELEKLSKKFDVLKSVEDNEFRILNENIIKTKSQPVSYTHLTLPTIYSV